MEVDPDRLARIGQLLVDELLIDPPAATLDLVEAGLIDSLGFMTLFAALESVFGLEIELDDMDLDNFRSVAMIATFLDTKLGVVDRPESR